MRRDGGCPVNPEVPGNDDDNLTLGAEARTLGSSSLLQPSSGKAMLGELRSKQSSFNSETSGFSTISSMSSVESLLEARREDPEELLLALGFGGQEADPVARIPERFLVQPSQARGVDLRRLVCHQETLSQRHDTGIPGQWHWQLRDAHIHWLQQRALGTDPDWRTPPPRALETARARAGVVPSILVTSGSATHDWC
ncbi:hypothetical protein IscW_ISCW022006 [Ixodes scapularis]|uniref:ITPR-interacting domain-containing protein n=1 Tax=Ixodes scapularis TaxID=6945 RepID=B7QAV2_IXOSC|nr:hypothetical protein IscW_ISCW022006 [Ixodes scapularis]|eukprot:XP_002412678.1 hypothetical protein IscW_ISCW022006 [Ixodes scapularis]